MEPDTNINVIQDLQTILADYQQISGAKNETGITIDTTSFFTLVIACSNNQDSINLRFVKENPDDFQVFEYVLDTDIPAINTLLSVRNYINNGGTAASCAYDCAGVYLGTDY